MNIRLIAGLIYDYTSGYPFLVSRLCKIMDEKICEKDTFPDKSSAWSKDGFQEALKVLLSISVRVKFISISKSAAIFHGLLY